MIPKIIHYCWFGHGEMPSLAKDCISSWHKYMPDWEYRLWNEDNYNLGLNVYAKEAYEAGKYAFVSDFVRLWALEREGGLYLDVDFEVYKPFDELLHHHAFAGFEGSKHQPVMMGVCASEPHGGWVTEVLEAYQKRHFVNEDGSLDLRTNVQFITAIMASNGFKQNGVEQDYRDLHVFPTDFFSPRLTTGEYLRSDNTYCEHKGLASWDETPKGWKHFLLGLFGERNRIRLIKMKRKFLG